MMKTKLFLIFMLVQLMCVSAIAQIDDRFSGEWIFESAELRESVYNDSKQETKTIYTSANLNELSYFNAITSMKLNREADGDTGSNYIMTTAGQYQNPLIQLSQAYFRFSDQERQDELDINEYGYVFTSAEKILLISHEVFYPKNGKPMKAQLYITLSRLSK